jgi:transposase
MGKPRKHYEGSFKAKVVLESLQKDVTQEKILAKYGITTSMLNRWRNQLLENLPSVFDMPAKREKQSKSESPEYLKKLIGEQTVEIDILKKALSVWD